MTGNRNFNLVTWMSGMGAGLAMVMVLLGGTAFAEKGFATLAGVPAQALSPTEMAAVEGKLLPDLTQLPPTAFSGLGGLPVSVVGLELLSPLLPSAPDLDFLQLFALPALQQALFGASFFVPLAFNPHVFAPNAGAGTTILGPCNPLFTVGC